MKVEKIIISLLVAALFAVASSVYYEYVNFNTGEASGFIARHTHRVIETVYEAQFQAMEVENASDKFILSHDPYYKALAHQNAALLNTTVKDLRDSVSDNSFEVERVNDLDALVADMEKNMPGLDSLNSSFSEITPRFFKSATAENYTGKVIAQTNEIINEEFHLLGLRRSRALASQRKTVDFAYYIAIAALLFIIIILFWLNRDIQKRRIAEKRIRQNEEKLRVMFEEVGDGIFSSDYTGKFTFINARLATLTGYSGEELLGKHFTFLVHPGWMERVKEFYARQFKNRIYETNYEFPIVTRQGEMKWVEQNVVLVSKGDKVDSFQCVLRDITKRRNTQEEIRRTNKFLDSVLENIPDMIFIKDAKDLRFMRFNKAGEELLGFLQEDLIGKNDYDFFPKEQADFFIEKDKEVIKNRKGVDIPEEPIQTKYGQRWLHTKKIPVSHTDGTPLYLLGISEDITERKKNEDTIIELNKNLARYVAELEESQRFYKTIARNFPDGTITVLDSNLNYIFVDGRELDAEGLNPQQLLGKPYLDRFSPEAGSEIKNNLLQIFHGDNVTFEAVLSGNYYIMHGAPLGTTGGVVDEILIVKQNITKLKQAEEKMRAAFEKEKLINELKSRFVSLASHEFRTPLSTILSSTELIGEYIEHMGKNPAVIKEKNIHHLKRIKTAIQNMVNTLNNFLSLDRLEQGKIVINPAEFHVKEFSTEVLEEIQNKLKPGQKIEYSRQSGDTTIFTDRLILKNIVLNLLANAIKYSPKDTIITYIAKVSKSGLEITVEDRGIGIPEDEQANLFERFFRATNTLNIEGTGLGLSIVKKYVDLLNGHISFTSRKNDGSIFKVFVANANVLTPSPRPNVPLGTPARMNGSDGGAASIPSREEGRPNETK